MEPIEKGNIFAIWKPKGPPSFAVITAIRKLTGEKKVGHAGTLDPLAEGIIVIGFGREGTKKLSELVAKEKEYVATIKLGYESSTDDEEGIVEKNEAKTPPSLRKINVVIKKFIGQIQQAPPIHSAMKVAGKRSYKLARQGKEFELPARTVIIKNIEILSYAWPILKVKVTTGPGVYIRSLARDLGKELGVGGYLTDLVRNRVGSFTKESCQKLELSFPENKGTRSTQE